MGSWTDATGLRREPARAVLRPERLDRDVVRDVHPVHGPLGDWVAAIWSLTWSVPVPASDTLVIPHPTVHLTLESGPAGEVRHGHRMPAALLHGVPQRRFAPDLPAHGWVVGLRLRPAAVLDLVGTPAHVWTGRVVSWPAAWPGWDLAAVWQADGPDARVAALGELAAERIGDRRPSPDAQRARSVERLVRTDRGIRTVEQLAERVAVSVRRLQRVCRDHLGVSPRWLLRRARVLDAHELLSTSELAPAEIAAHLGWYDQAHMTRDYAAVTGVPPARLRRLLGADRTHTVVSPSGGPRRLQLSRKRGGRLPEGARSVAAPSRFANPYRPERRTPEANARAVAGYRRHLRENPDLVAVIRAELADCDVVCWCAPGLPCHGDVILAVARGEDP